MAKDRIADEVRRILVETLGCCTEEELTPGALLDDDLGMDSLDRTELAMEIEEQLLDGDEIDAEIAGGWKTVGDLIASVKQMAALLPARR
jgi:acyl carrier protein